MKKVNITQIQENFLKKNYRKYGSKYCADNTGISIGLIWSLANKLGIKLTREEKRNIHINARKRKTDWYDVGFDQFFNIEAKEVAYLLGFIWADGNIKIRFNANNASQSYRVSIEISTKDYINLKDIFQKIGKWNIHHRTMRKCNRVPVTMIYTDNKPIVMFLAENDYGIKSLESPSKILNKIPDKLKHYFWRGLFDGDGCLCYSKSYLSLTISGSYNQNWADLENLLLSLNIKYSKIRNISKVGHKSSAIRCQNIKGIESFCKYIYKNFNLDQMGLKRKYEKWLLGKAKLEIKYNEYTNAETS